MYIRKMVHYGWVTSSSTIIPLFTQTMAPVPRGGRVSLFNQWIVGFWHDSCFNDNQVTHALYSYIHTYVYCIKYLYSTFERLSSLHFQWQNLLKIPCFILVLTSLSRDVRDIWRFYFRIGSVQIAEGKNLEHSLMVGAVRFKSIFLSIQHTTF